MSIAAKSAPPAEKRHRGTMFYVIVVFAMVVLYVLSMGPVSLFVSKMRRNGRMSNETGVMLTYTLYVPVIKVAKQTDATRRLYHWYKELWIGPYFGDPFDW